MIFRALFGAASLLGGGPYSYPYGLPC